MQRGGLWDRNPLKLTVLIPDSVSVMTYRHAKTDGLVIEILWYETQIDYFHHIKLTAGRYIAVLPLRGT